MPIMMSLNKTFKVHATGSMDGIKLEVKKCEAWLHLKDTSVKLSGLPSSIRHFSEASSYCRE